MKVVWRGYYNIKRIKNNYKGDVVLVFWQDNHNIQEIKTIKCKSDDIGKEVSDDYESRGGETFRKSEPSTMLGESKYLKCYK